MRTLSIARRACQLREGVGEKRLAVFLLEAVAHGAQSEPSRALKLQLEPSTASDRHAERPELIRLDRPAVGEHVAKQHVPVDAVHPLADGGRRERRDGLEGGQIVFVELGHAQVAKDLAHRRRC
jgi:hypothetical protein